MLGHQKSRAASKGWSLTLEPQRLHKLEPARKVVSLSQPRGSFRGVDWKRSKWGGQGSRGLPPNFRWGGTKFHWLSTSGAVWGAGGAGVNCRGAVGGVGAFFCPRGHTHFRGDPDGRDQRCVPIGWPAVSPLIAHCHRCGEETRRGRRRKREGTREEGGRGLHHPQCCD